MKPLKHTLAEKLRNCRRDAGLTQPELAQAIGVKEFQTISKWERGINIPEMHFLERLAALFGRPVGYFMDQGIDMQNLPGPTETQSAMAKTISLQQDEIEQLRLENKRLLARLGIRKGTLTISAEAFLQAYPRLLGPVSAASSNNLPHTEAKEILSEFNLLVRDIDKLLCLEQVLGLDLSRKLVTGFRKTQKELPAAAVELIHFIIDLDDIGRESLLSFVHKRRGYDAQNNSRSPRRR